MNVKLFTIQPVAGNRAVVATNKELHEGGQYYAEASDLLQNEAVFTVVARWLPDSLYRYLIEFISEVEYIIPEEVSDNESLKMKQAIDQVKNLTKSIEQLLEIDTAEQGKSVVRRGYAQAINGKELWINTPSDEMIKITIKNRELLWALYCNNLKVTVEVEE